MPVFENRMLRRTFGPKRDEVTGGWRKFHNQELHNLHSSPNNIKVIKSKRMRERGCSTDGMKNAYKIFVEKPEGKRPLGRPSSRW
jgi:hypothetical protein